MNVKRPTDHSAMFKALDDLMAVSLPQMELYREIGRLDEAVGKDARWGIFGTLSRLGGRGVQYQTSFKIKQKDQDCRCQ